ncbi:FecR domain-containing protein [Pectobacterium wasabiae]|uniref:Iron dicitrate transport regulator FecR n=1 Tax=Pectobacterium wasabiae TaxID=55208 RepID=A0AAW3EID6_9GAMM|nr:FecR domain-containing protein [Pectobacterium wasabiae]AOR63977.1 iron dicitrate transport regulator FecR [Pectobacterium wasabiae CFBP 3304]EJS94374.1 Fec operon regulator FecR [Pectobacterium wasabiae CFBP 3304]KFX08598.1 iron dicitrate transport regulator FecR [Pectobacterium wasabiae]KGA28625.1 iron dicitrate transport regulator FecR [Pectobacterium wasabiae]
MISSITSSIPKDVLYAAAEWYATLYDEDCSEHDRQTWQRWLHQDEAHRLAWQQVEQVHARFHAVDSQLASSVLSKRGEERRRILKLLVIASMTGGVGFSLPWESYAADYRTGKGETRELSIETGMTLWLNTDSALNQQGDPALSQPLTFQLIKGELMLDNQTAHAVRLTTPHGDLTAAAHSCQLALRYTSTHSVLSVFRGEVLLQTAVPAAQRVIAGQQVIFTRDKCSEPAPAESFRQSWRKGQLVADGMPLGQFINEISRYHNGYFHVDSAVANLRISGVFPLQETDRLLDAVTRTLPVKVTTRFSWWIDIRPS